MGYRVKFYRNETKLIVSADNFDKLVSIFHIIKFSKPTLGVGRTEKYKANLNTMALLCLTRYFEEELWLFWRYFGHWLHRAFSYWDLSMHPVTKISFKLQQYSVVDMKQSTAITHYSFSGISLTHYRDVIELAYLPPWWLWYLDGWPELSTRFLNTTPARLFGLGSENFSHGSPSSFGWDVKSRSLLPSALC